MYYLVEVKDHMRPIWDLELVLPSGKAFSLVLFQLLKKARNMNYHSIA